MSGMAGARAKRQPGFSDEILAADGWSWSYVQGWRRIDCYVNHLQCSGEEMMGGEGGLSSLVVSGMRMRWFCLEETHDGTQWYKYERNVLCCCGNVRMRCCWPTRKTQKQKKRASRKRDGAKEQDEEDGTMGRWDRLEIGNRRPIDPSIHCSIPSID